MLINVSNQKNNSLPKTTFSFFLGVIIAILHEKKTVGEKRSV